MSEVWVKVSNIKGPAGFTFAQDAEPEATAAGQTWCRPSSTGGGTTFVAVARDGVLEWVRY